MEATRMEADGFVALNRETEITTPEVNTSERKPLA
jgi:hypothetical protein